MLQGMPLRRELAGSVLNRRNARDFDIKIINQLALKQRERNVDYE